MIYQNNNQAPWAFIVIVVLAAFLFLGVLLNEKLAGLTPALPIPPSGGAEIVSVDEGLHPSNDPGVDPAANPGEISETPTPTATSQPTVDPVLVFATQTAVAQTFSATATNQALMQRATQVNLDILQTQTAQRSTEQAYAQRSTQAAETIINQEKLHDFQVTQTAQAARQQVESSQASAQATEPWIQLGLLVVGGATIFVLGIGITVWIVASAYAKKQLALAKFYTERRHLLEVQIAIRKK